MKLDAALCARIQAYWNSHIHDLEIVQHPVGTPEFFASLEEYRFDKLRYLPERVDFSGYGGQKLLEVGCGVGTDLLRFARGGADVTGVDLSETAIQLAKLNFAQNRLTAELSVMNGEQLEFARESFDVVYAHGVLQYTADANRMIQEIHRVLRIGGQAILMVYNKYSWLNAMSKVLNVDLEHSDAPVLRMFSAREFRRMLQEFGQVKIVPDRFPVKTRLHRGFKARLYNDIFVTGFGLLPRTLVRPVGWHLLAFVTK